MTRWRSGAEGVTGMLKKKSQVERLAIAYTLLASIWDEMANGKVEDNLLQLAVNAQTDINRIVWKLNELNGGDGDG